MAERAVAAGATAVYPVTEEHGWLLGRVQDPFGHQWEIGKPLVPWPPAGGRPEGQAARQGSGNPRAPETAATRRARD